MKERLDKLIENLNQILSQIQNNHDSDFIDGKVTKHDAKLLIEFILNKINNDHEFQIKLLNLVEYESIDIKKGIVDGVELPRTISLHLDTKGEIVCDVFTLSKDSYNQKTEMRVLDSGAYKGLKAVYRLDTHGKSKKIARLNVVIGPAYEGEYFEHAQKRGKVGEEQIALEQKYETLKNEVERANRVNSPYVGKPSLGTPYKKTKNGKTFWCVNVSDEFCICSFRNFIDHSFMKDNVSRLDIPEINDIHYDLAQGKIPKLFIEMAKEFLLGLKAMHDMNILHGDIKPENILLQRSEDGKLHLKIIDLGLSREVDDSHLFYADSGIDYFPAGAFLFEFFYGYIPASAEDPKIKNNPILCNLFFSEARTDLNKLIGLCDELIKNYENCKTPEKIFDELCNRLENSKVSSFLEVAMNYSHGLNKTELQIFNLLTDSQARLNIPFSAENKGKILDEYNHTSTKNGYKM